MTAPSHWVDLKGTPPPSSDPMNIADTETRVSSYKRDRSNSPALSIKSSRHSVHDDVKSTAPSRAGSDNEESGESESDLSESSTPSSPTIAPGVLSQADLPSSPRTPPPSSRAKRARARYVARGLDITPKAISRTASMGAYDGFKSPIPFRPFGEGFIGELKTPDPLNLNSRGDAWSDQEDGILEQGEPTTRFFGPPPTLRMPHAIHGSDESAKPVPSGTPATFFAGSSSLNDVIPDVTHDVIPDITHDVTGDVMTQPQESRPVQPQLPDLKDPSNTATEETLIVGEAAFKALEALNYVTNFFKHRNALDVCPGGKDHRFPQMGEPIYCLLTSMFNSGWDRLPINGESGLTIIEALRQYLSPPPDVPMTDSSPPPQGKGKGKKVRKSSDHTIPTPRFPPGIVVGQSNPTDRIDHNAMNIDQAPPAEGILPIPQNDVSSSGKTHDVSSVLNPLKAKNDVTSSKPAVGSIRVSRAPPPPSHHVTPRNGNGNFERSIGRSSSDGQAQPPKPNISNASDMPPPIPQPNRKASIKPLTEHFNKKTSFADAARRGVQPTSSTSTSSNIDGVKMREMILAFPDLSYDKVLAMYKAGFGSAQSQAPEPTSSTSAVRAKPKMTTHGPTRRQVLIPFEGSIIADRIKDFNKASEFCNRGLIAAQSKLRVESVRESYNGISIATSGVATSVDLNTIKSWLKKAWQLGDAIPVEPRLPQSKSFLKIVGVPYWVANSSNPLSPAFVEQALGQSSLFENVILAARPRVMKASPKSDTAVVWFDIWDSQNGTKAKTLVNRTINFGRHIGTIRATSMHPGVAQCRNCWRWGHPTHACRALGARCQICGGPHRIENHRSMAWCCKANPKSSPPCDATPDGIPCPHLENFKCLNCKGDHHANDNKCPFWRNRFDRTWHSNKAAESRTARANNLISSVRIYSQNVGRSYALVDTILESRKLDFDIIFLQEPPWNHIRKAPSTTNPEGDDVIGAPIHPEWLCMARPTKPNDSRPRTLTYVHRQLSRMRPILRQEWVNHRDIQILGLFNKGNYIHLLNVYSDSSSSAINFLSTNFIDIPNIIYMGGDFNCRSPEWDPLASHVPQSAITLTELVDCFNLSRSEPTLFSPTHFSSVENYDNTVIDLIFCANSSTSHIIDANSRLPSDHAPLLMDLPIRPDYINYKKRVLPKDSDEESAFISQVSEHLAVLDCSNIHTSLCLDNISHSISSILSDSWNSNSKIDWRAFRKATRVAKRSFFDERIHEIASTNKRPWDLMEWVKQRKLPAIEGIRYQGRPCNDLPDLWDALHSSYNSASGRPVSPHILNEMKTIPSRSWANFSALELSESLQSCANSSAPGPDHVSWRHLKSIVAHNDCLKNIILIANASCVVPVATYGFRLWYFEGARNKALLKSLSSMQRRAAIWITGAFRTSPSGGTESIAGLIPIHLHLRKLAIRSLYRVSTLPFNHAL
ncbi:hypothetical protein D9756_011008 [Leucocoprinus leucothites]|uniref:Endonuclease/exonuclease/phosphatase domain-containing protein n=1 Tax=Leucocoprinus leucothites TaxID=201217 RepID=A0A8H5FRJ8_9AGAR|nr:hypothetical protein D9756_011008 [Leucoagaricus leucothites]